MIQICFLLANTLTINASLIIILLFHLKSDNFELLTQKNYPDFSPYKYLKTSIHNHMANLQCITSDTCTSNDIMIISTTY